MEKYLLAPSLLSADFGNLKNSIEKIEQKGAIVHVDVMDGIFVPQISFGQPVVSSIRHLTNLPFDVHLMTKNPENQIESFVKAGADWLTFHIEACVHAHRLLTQIRDMGKKAGISIVPSTPVSAITEILGSVDLVLVMTVNPGFGGQKMIDFCVEKIRQLAEIRKERNLDFKISVDGGVNAKTFKTVCDAGADIIVSGSSFFTGELDAVL